MYLVQPRSIVKDEHYWSLWDSVVLLSIEVNIVVGMNNSLLSISEVVFLWWQGGTCVLSKCTSASVVAVVVCVLCGCECELLRFVCVRTNKGGIPWTRIGDVQKIKDNREWTIWNIYFWQECKRKERSEYECYCIVLLYVYCSLAVMCVLCVCVCVCVYVCIM
jgi:hypothetical protein